LKPTEQLHRLGQSLWLAARLQEEGKQSFDDDSWRELLGTIEAEPAK